MYYGDITQKRVEKLAEKDNAAVFFQLASYYTEGTHGLPRDLVKANELYRKAGELGVVLWDIITWVIPIMMELA